MDGEFQDHTGGMFMRKILILSASFAALSVVPSLAFAEVIKIEPEVKTWVMEQPGESIVIDEDVAVGAVLPKTVKVIEVPKFKKYRFAIVNNKRVIIEPRTRKVIAIY
jgi:Protein of unknown function (DUF1236)